MEQISLNNLVFDIKGLKVSPTRLCMQYMWSEPYYFPCCPEELEENAIMSYFNNLEVGFIFAYSEYSPKLVIVKFMITKNRSSILVMCERETATCEIDGFKPWLISEIILEHDFFIHKNLGSYFEREDAEQYWRHYNFPD